MKEAEENAARLAHQLCPDHPYCREWPLMGQHERNIFLLAQQATLRFLCARLHLDLCQTPEALVEALDAYGRKP